MTVPIPAFGIRVQPPHCWKFPCAILVAVSLVATLPLGQSTAVASDNAEKRELYFEDHIAPLLEAHCIDCHNPDEAEARLDLTTAAGLLKGSESGPVVAARNPHHSLLLEVVESGEMPMGGDRLPEESIHLLRDWIAAGLPFRNPPPAATQPLNQHDVVPILLLRCTACHGAELQQSGLDLRTTASLRRGGNSGPVAIAGNPDGSLMIQRIEQQLCPPHGQLLKFFVERPGTSEVEKLRTWIAEGMQEVEDPPEVIAGAPDPHVTDEDRKHWSFQPLPRRVAVPRFANVEIAQPIDAFIYEKLSAAGLDFAPQAERDVLIRRAYFDLIGLPPSPEDLRLWQRHTSDDWYADMIEHLLASPHYGERWGRYWLDVAGYADSEGGTAEDPVREFAWKYRDYVIRSFNADKPWDRFLQEQIAGDELAPYNDPATITDEVVDNLIATGFLRMGVDETGSRTMNFVPERLALIGNAMTVVGSGVMGLTIDCARCHSHKYDPIPHTDYFRFKAIFQGAFDEHDWMSWKTRRLDVATPQQLAEREAANVPLETAIKELTGKRAAAVKAWQDRYYREAWPKFSEAEQAEFTAALKAKATRRSLREQELVARYQSEIRPTEAVLVERHPELATELAAIDAEIADKQEQLIPPPTIRALWDRGRPSPTYVLIRGEYNRPGRLVGPGVPSVLTDGKTPLKIEPPWPGAESTGRRLAFARWLTTDDHPLTARVIVNRVWAMHFGQGIVKTLDNFGVQGARPTHPELLDWLARDLVDNGWSLKSLHRRIMLSRTYRQSSQRTQIAEATDPENKLLSRMPLRRLDAEALRDALLAVSGQLDTRLYGPPSPVVVREDGLILERPSRQGTYRRSIYMRLRRTEMPTLLSAFDYPEMQPNCTERSTSTVSTQSLILINTGRIYDLAGAFASQLLNDNNQDPNRWIRRAYQQAFGRAPDKQELATARATLERLQQAWIDSGTPPEEAPHRVLTTFCHTLMNSAEFAYID